MSSGPKHLSYSQLELWTKCPRQWKFRYIDQMDADPWLAAWAGSAFHSWVEYWEISQMPPETFSMFLDDQIELERAKTDKEPKISGGETLDDWYELGVKLCRKWVEWRTSEPHNVLANEAEFLAPLPGLKLPIKGFVDAVVDDGVVDWKSGKKMPTPVQIKIYGAILRALGWDVNKAGYYNARTGKVATWHKLDYSLEDVALLFKPLDEGIAKGEYPANTGYHCKWCPGFSKCPEGLRFKGRIGPSD